MHEADGMNRAKESRHALVEEGTPSRGLEDEQISLAEEGMMAQKEPVSSWGPQTVPHDLEWSVRLVGPVGPKHTGRL